jgi:hypothetical protein
MLTDADHELVMSTRHIPVHKAIAIIKRGP